MIVQVIIPAPLEIVCQSRRKRFMPAHYSKKLKKLHSEEAFYAGTLQQKIKKNFIQRKRFIKLKKLHSEEALCKRSKKSICIFIFNFWAGFYKTKKTMFL